MRRLCCVAVLVAGCAHAAIKKQSDCDKVAGEKRVECNACLLQNKAEGWLGVYEYRPDEPQGQRCVRTK
jgi:hypothetical protein